MSVYQNDNNIKIDSKIVKPLKAFNTNKEI